MNSPGLLWTILVPLIAGMLGTLIMAGRRLQRIRDDYGPWLRLGALLAVCAGLLLEAVFLALTPDASTLSLFGISFTTSAPARYVLTTANVSLLCAALYYWTVPSNGEVKARRGESWVPLALGGASSLLTCAGLAADRLAVTLLLFGVALVVCMLAFSIPKPSRDGDDQEDEAEAGREAKAYAGALKHIALAVIAATVWIGGATLVERYGLNLENRGLLQFGIGLVAVGLVIWVGSMPFAASWGDLVEAAPTAAIVALGAGAPVALVAGLSLLAPIEGSLAHGAAAGWLGPAGALLAGLRALGTVRRPQRAIPADDSTMRLANLKAMAVALAVSWGVFGILSGSQTGAVGAVLIATNIALAVPLLLVGERWAVVIGVASLLGLPPFGGFAGMVLVAQSAANSGGLWLGLLLIGSALVGGAWLARRDQSQTAGVEDEDGGWSQRLTDPVLLLTVALVIAQVALFCVASSRLAPLLKWATVPWLAGS